MTADERYQLVVERMQSLSPTHVELIDESPAHRGHAGNTGGAHFNLTVVSATFTDKSRLERHRMVLACVNDLIPNEIHALKIATFVPSEYKG